MIPPPLNLSGGLGGGLLLSNNFDPLFDSTVAEEEEQLVSDEVFTPFVSEVSTDGVLSLGFSEPLSHWSISLFSSLAQGRRMLDADDEAQPKLSDLIKI